MKTDYTVAGFIVKDYKVLLVHHRKLDKWLPPGGHVEKNEAFDDAILREIKEETGIDAEITSYGRDWRPGGEKFGGDIVRMLANPFNINIHKVTDHLHLNLNYLCSIKNNSKAVSINSEIKGAEWFSKDDLEDGDIPEDVKKLALAALETSIDDL